MQKVECCYQGKNRCFGIFDTLDQGMFINEIVRGVLQATKKSKLTQEEIEVNVKITKEGAKNALSELLEDGAWTDLSRKEAVSNAVSKLIKSSSTAHPQEVAGRATARKSSQNASIASTSSSNDIVGPWPCACGENVLAGRARCGKCRRWRDGKIQKRYDAPTGAVRVSNGSNKWVSPGIKNCILLII